MLNMDGSNILNKCYCIYFQLKYKGLIILRSTISFLINMRQCCGATCQVVTTAWWPGSCFKSKVESISEELEESPGLDWIIHNLKDHSLPLLQGKLVCQQLITNNKLIPILTYQKDIFAFWHFSESIIYSSLFPYIYIVINSPMKQSLLISVLKFIHICMVYLHRFKQILMFTKLKPRDALFETHEYAQTVLIYSLGFNVIFEKTINFHSSKYLYLNYCEIWKIAYIAYTEM